MVEGDGRNLVRDSAGIMLSGVRAAKKEAIGLAWDVTRHELHGLTQTWKVVVTDEQGNEVLRIALSEVRANKLRALLHFGRRVAKLASGATPRAIAALAALAALAMAAAIAVVTERSGGYQTAAAPTEGAVLAVRFVPQASAADITAFLDAYRASVVGGPQPGGFYRLRIADAALPPEELASLVGRMAQEKVVEFAAAAQ
jgi:hypothetical protein